MYFYITYNKNNTAFLNYIAVLLTSILIFL